MAFQRIAGAIRMECGQLAEGYGEREAAGKLATVIESLQKLESEYIAESQSRIIRPTLVLDESGNAHQ